MTAVLIILPYLGAEQINSIGCIVCRRKTPFLYDWLDRQFLTSLQILCANVVDCNQKRYIFAQVIYP